MIKKFRENSKNKFVKKFWRRERKKKKPSHEITMNTIFISAFVMFSGTYEIDCTLTILVWYFSHDFAGS